jgi:hypothetical protein
VQSFRKDSGASLASAVPGEIDALSFHSRRSSSSSFASRNQRPNRSFQYLLNAAKAGKYDFKVSAMTEKTDGTLEVFVNHNWLAA